MPVSMPMWRLHDSWSMPVSMPMWRLHRGPYQSLCQCGDFFLVQPSLHANVETSSWSMPVPMPMWRLPRGSCQSPCQRGALETSSWSMPVSMPLWRFHCVSYQQKSTQKHQQKSTQKHQQKSTQKHQQKSTQEPPEPKTISLLVTDRSNSKRPFGRRATRAQEPPEPKSHQRPRPPNAHYTFMYFAEKLVDMQYLRYDFRNPIQLRDPVRDPGRQGHDAFALLVSYVLPELALHLITKKSITLDTGELTWHTWLSPSPWILANSHGTIVPPQPCEHHSRRPIRQIGGLTPNYPMLYFRRQNKGLFYYYYYNLTSRLSWSLQAPIVVPEPLIYLSAVGLFYLGILHV